MRAWAWLLAALPLAAAPAADLVISGQSQKVYENGAYGRLVVQNSSNITIRSCTFKAASGVVGTVSGSRNITLEGLDITGLGSACTGLHLTGNSHLTVAGCKVYNVADDGIQLHTGDHHYFHDNEIFLLLGYGTSSGGPCHNGHSDAFEVFNLDSGEFRRNLVYDVRSNAALFLGNWGGETCTDLLVENNLFYTPQCGFVVYVHYVTGIRIYNNVFWKGQYGGVAVGPQVKGMELYNNILHSINYAHLKTAFDPAQHREDHNLIGTLAGQGFPAVNAHDRVVGDPRFRRIPPLGNSTLLRDVTAADFELQSSSPAIEAGLVSASTPPTDYYGRSRTGRPEIGAIEFGGTASDTVPPVLTAIQSRDVGGGEATVVWTTNEPADSQVEYGPSTAYGSRTTLDTRLVTSHSVALGALLPRTTYHFRVRSMDGAGNTQISPDQTFTTLEAGAGKVPVVAVTASTHDGNIPQNSVDGLLSTRWSAEGDGQWIQYDLGEECRLEAILLAVYKGNEVRLSFDVKLSSDSQRWTQALQAASSGTTLAQERFTLGAVTGRYVQIVGHGNNANRWNSLTEVTFLGTRLSDRTPPAPPRNVRVKTS